MANVAAPQQPQNQPTESPLMGLYLDRPAHMIDPKGFSACNNVRIELGRVRSDLLGWTTAANLTAVPGGTLYLDTFVTASGRQFVIAVSPTDLYVLYDSASPAAYANRHQQRYATPLWTNRGAISPSSVAINNGSPTVTGTNTLWNHQYQGGVTVTTSGSTAQGSTTVVITGSPKELMPGQVITCATAGLLANGTQYVGDSTSGSNHIILSLPTTNVIPGSTVLTIGNNTVTGAGRTNVMAGDFIAFRNPVAAATDIFPIVGADTWYQVQSVNSDTSLTLTTNYVGTNLSGNAYMVRQTFKGPGNAGSVLVNESDVFNSAFLGAVPLTPASEQAAFNDTWFYTNGFDPVVMIWAAQNAASVASQAFGSMYPPSIPFLAKDLKAYKGILVFGGLGFPSPTWPVTSATAPATTFTQGNEIASSDSSAPVQLNSGIAFQGIAISGPFTIAKLGILGQVLMMYGIGAEATGAATEDNHSGVVTSASLVGFPTIWTFSDVIQTRGPISGEAVAVFADRHQFISIDGEYRYNGLFIQVMNDQVWREVLLGFDFTRRQALFHFQCSPHGDLIWAVPQATDPGGQTYASSAYVEHYMEQANSYLFKPYTKRDFPFTSCCTYQPTGGAAPNYPIQLASDTSGTIWQLYASNTQNGTPALATVTWAARKIGNGRSRVLVTRVYPEIEYQSSPVSTVNVTLTLQNYAAGPVTITDTQAFDPSYPGSLGYTQHYRRGAVAAVTISDSAGVGWACDGYDWDYLDGGVRLKS